MRLETGYLKTGAAHVMKSSIDPELINELRQCIYLCRMFRKTAMRRKDWHVEIAAEQRLNQSRKLYRVALALGDKT